MYDISKNKVVSDLLYPSVDLENITNKSSAIGFQ